MDTETKKLFELLFPKGSADELASNVNTNEYITKVGSYHLDELHKETNRLKEENTSILEQTQELAINNYQTFIETADCSRELFKQFNVIEKTLDNLLDHLPSFEEKCHSFSKETSGINNLRKLNSLTLTRNAQLLEILELPQLMDTFINDGLYEDALELTSYVRTKLYARHPDIPIFKSIADDIEKSWLIMLHKLVGELRSDISLPKCLQIVGHLRRMDIFTESELRLKFLQTRDSWFQSSLNAISTDDVNYHVSKTIEVTRVNLFNIITQYRAIFNDDEHSPLANMKSKNVNHNVIFFSWIRNKIAEFLTSLEHDLTVGITSLESILGQCMYFGLSFSKVGCDFRPSLVPIFTHTALRYFQHSLTTATTHFDRNMDKFTLINKNHPNVPWKSKQHDPIQPPDSLLEFYPLAEYLNQTLTAFNALRLCPPLAVVGDVVNVLETSLASVARGIVHLYGQEQQAFTANAKDAFTRLCMCFADDLVPYVQKCVHVVFPPGVIAAHVGVTVTVLQTEQISYLNRRLVIEPLSHLLPARLETSFKVLAVEEEVVVDVLVDESRVLCEKVVTDSIDN